VGGRHRGTPPGRRRQAALLAGLGAALAGCGAFSREVAIQKAQPGDLLVDVGGNRVELVKPFTPGIANGLHKGVVKVSGSGSGGPSQLHRVTVICSVKGEPGWPTYDNIYGDPIADVETKTFPLPEKRWQILYHFDGRVEKTGKLESDGWVARLKDNLCRKGDFRDS